MGSEVFLDNSVLVKKSGLDHPTGRFVSIPSSISNRPVHYFVPDPLRDLLERCSDSAVRQKHEDRQEIYAAAFLNLVARSGYAGVVDQKQANALFDLLWQAPSIRTVADLRTVVGHTSPYAGKFRQQIVFTGGRVASEAVHVYAPHEAVPRLMAQLVDGIDLSADRISVVDRVAVLGFFCLHAHPFRDGNGRWARALALSVERRSLIATMAAMSFQTICMQALAESVWPKTRTYGLREYIDICNLYSSSLLAAHRASTSFETIQSLNEVLRKASRDKSKLKSVARCLFVRGELNVVEAKSILGASSRVVDGLFQSLQDCGLTVSNQSVLIDVLFDEVGRHARMAVKIALENLEGSS